jgi:Tol biopolymer transport system component
VDDTPRPIAASPTASEFAPDVSPDGRHVVYVSNESGRYEVWVTTFPDPGERWQVTSGGATEPRWSADGRELFFIAGGQMTAASVATDDGFQVTAQRPLFPVAPFTLYGIWSRSYDVTPDGERFVMLCRGQQAPARMVVVTGWQAP